MMMNCGIKRILQLKEALQYKVISIFDENNKDITDLCMYSWSTDGVCWTGWTDSYNYNSIGKNIEGDFYLRVLLFGSFSKISVDGMFTNCYNITIDSSNVFLTNFCENTNLFQPYNNLDCALELQQQLADSIICMFGIPVYYIRVNPDKESVDYTFKEYFLHKVDSIKQLKLMIPDGQMPSSNPRLTEFDFDWEIDWETELSKSQFATAFGDDAYPKAGDFIYIPMMKRMWDVNAAYDEKNEGLMWRSTTWKLALTKYNESTNVDMNGFDDILDNWAVNTYDNVFAKKEETEQQRTSGQPQISSPSFSATNLYDIFMEDAIRKQYTKNDINILDKTYNNRSLIVSRNLYKFRNPNACVIYQEPICGDSGLLSFIIETQDSTINYDRNIIEFGDIIVGLSYDNKELKLKFDDLIVKLEPFKSYIVICKWNRKTFTKELNVYNYTHNQDIPIYKLRPEMYWFDFENPVCEIVGHYNNDFNIKRPMQCMIHAYPCSLTNIKLYNTYLDKEESIKEVVKYITKHENCIINDLARPILSGHGYAVK